MKEKDPMSANCSNPPTASCGVPTRNGPCVMSAGHAGLYHRAKPRSGRPLEHARARWMTPPAQPARPDWLANPALPCRRMDPELFFPLDIRQPDPAVLAACGACPARDACLGRALQAGEIEPESGIWGGTTPAERRIMLRLDGAA